MSLLRYPEYKESVIPWIGPLPSHWKVNRLMAVASWNDDTLPEDCPPDLEMAYVDIGSVSLELGVERVEILRFAEAPSRARRTVRDGDVIVSTVRTYLKAIASVREPPANTVVSTGFAVIRPGKSLDPGFAKYALQAPGFVDEVISRSTGVSYPAINASDLVRIHIVAPPVDEQAGIGLFLDREIAKITALIAEQQKLIALLAEKRQATISHAVTRGLDRDASMKDSGVAWLGEVPEHWKVRTIARSSIKITNGYVGPTRDILVEEGVPYIQATNIKDGKIRFDADYFVTAEWSEDHGKSILREGDVLVVQTGAGTGDVGLVAFEEVGFNCHALIIISPKKEMLSGAFLASVLQSSYGRARLASIQTGAMHPHLNCGEIKFVEIPIAPLEEQTAIVNFLRVEIAGLEALAAESARAIELLEERRTALIAAAVTGQIDVRGEMPQSAVQEKLAA
jgi:type I restriction enzyme, S subunit